MQMVLMTDLNTYQLGTSVNLRGNACPCTAAVVGAPQPGVTASCLKRSWCTTLLCALQIMLDRARAAPGTNIIGIFTSGALDKLAAALQVVLPFRTCCPVDVSFACQPKCGTAGYLLPVHVIALAADVSVG